jgi:betaine-aldehyde dehydrogenase
MMSTTKTSKPGVLPTERGLFYGGSWHRATSGKTTPVSSPSTGEDLGLIEEANASDVDKAVTAAAKAYPGWRDTPVAERVKCIRKAANLLREHAEELAMIDAMDGGNPYQWMLADVLVSADYLDYFAGLATEVTGTTIPVAADILNYTLREPLGVVARIGAFNHPALFSTARAGAPLAVGNTLIIKPADQTPLSTLRIAELWASVFPPGVFNVVNGGRDAGAALAEHPKVAKVGFIGSVIGGRNVMRSASSTVKKISLELGGKNALVACSDADPAEVAVGVVSGMNLRSVAGQSCNSTSRVYVHADIYDAVVAELAKKVSAVKIGLPTDRDTEMGCLSSRPQFEKTLGYIAIAKEEGARLIVGGKPPAESKFLNGFFVEPTVFADVTDDMRIAREEVFGPVVSVLKWTDEENMLERVNALEYGLTASIWTRDLDRAHRLASRIEAGFMWINDAGPHYLGVPFGGYKQSGIGKEECFDEMLACTQVKNVNMRIRRTPLATGK